MLPLVDLARGYRSMKDEIDKAIAAVIEDTSFVLGEHVAAFEENFASYCGCSHAVGVGNGTDALRIALRSLGIGPGDEVITVPNSFIATAEPIAELGAAIRFVDVDPRTALMDTRALAGAISPRTKAVIPVHLYGQPVDMDSVLELTKERGIFVVEDAAQAHGARYKGRRVGSFGDMACFSFYPGKNLGAFGDGGAVTTNNTELAEKAGKLRDHGRLSKYEHDVLGYNSRLDGIQGAVLDVKLKYLDRGNEARRRHAAHYGERFCGLDVTIPHVGADVEHVYHLYVLTLASRELRDGLIEHLTASGISAGIHYPVPLHLQPAFGYLGLSDSSYQVTEDLAGRIVSLPMFPELTEEEIEQICVAVSGFLETAS